MFKINEIKKSKIVIFLKDKHYIENVPFIMVGILAAVVCCAYAKIFSYLEHWGLLLISRNPYIFLGLTPLLFVFAYFLVVRFAPGAFGSGIPQVMTCVDPPYQHLSNKFLSLKVLAIKFLSSCVGIFAGAAIGREGPSLQISAAIAHNVGRFFKRMGIVVKTEQLLIAGAASGLAAAFNTPIGGVVYAIEELSQEHVRKYKDVLLLAVVISGFSAQLLMGSYLYLGYPQVPTNLYFQSIVIISAVSLLCGVLGTCFSVLLSKFIVWRSHKKQSTQFVFAGVVGLMLILGFIFFGERVLFSGKESINHILFQKDSVAMSEVLMRFMAPLISSATGIAGGIFAPSLSAGAVIGGFISELVDPGLRTLLGLAGMIGFLTGVTHSPITSFVLVLEMTDRHSSVFPMMFAAVFSSLGSHLFAKASFYEVTVERIKSAHPLPPS